MPSSLAARRKYAKQRPPKTPPHITLRTHRLSHHLTLEDVATRVEEITGDKPTKGALSAIESGTRGISAELKDALEKAYGFEPGSITTTYKPRGTTAAVAEDVA